MNKRIFLQITLLLIAVFALLGFAANKYRNSETESVYPSDPVHVTLADLTDNGEQVAFVRLTWEHPEPAISNTQGTVTELSEKNAAGFRVGLGQQVIQIDGVWRIAANYPFYRTLTIGDSGKDVEALHHLLQARGLPASPEPVFDETTAIGVQQLKAMLNAEPLPTFEPELAVFVPNFNAEAALAVQLGQPVTPGMAILKFAPKLANAKVSPGGSPERTLLLHTLSEHRLNVREHIFELSENLELSEPDLALLSTLVDPDNSEVTGRVSAAEPVKGAAVPISALLSNHDLNTTCIVVENNGEYLVRDLFTAATNNPGIRRGPIWLIRETILANPHDFEDDFAGQC